jgi:hypothetical protein
MNDDVLKKETEPAANEIVWAFDLRRASIGEPNNDLQPVRKTSINLGGPGPGEPFRVLVAGAAPVAGPARTRWPSARSAARMSF